MTNLTSEQYRDVIKHVPNATEEIPNVQQLLRRAVQTFYKKFHAYPELAGVAPGNVAIFGDQLQFNGGIVMPVATPMATIVVGRKAPGKRITVATSSDVGKPHKVSFSFSAKRPLAPGCPKWLNCIKGVIEAFGPVPTFEAVFETTLPKGGGFGSIPALEVAFYTFLEILVGKKTNPIEKAEALKDVEGKFENQKFGLVDRMASILARDRQIMVVDCKTNEVLWIPFFQNEEVDIIAVDAHLNFENYDPKEIAEMDKYLTKVCEILGVESLRHCNEDFEAVENKFNSILADIRNEESKDERASDSWTVEEYEIMINKAKYFLTELHRIDEAIQAWNLSDVKTFSGIMVASHNSLRNEFGFDNPVLNFLVDTSTEVEGVLGSKATGLGCGIITFVYKNKTQEYCKYLREKFLENQDQLAAELRLMLQREKEKQHDKRKSTGGNSGPSADHPGNAKGNKESEAKKTDKGEKEKKCLERKKVPCVENVEKQGRCGTWTHFQELPKREDPSQKKSAKAGYPKQSEADSEEEGEFYGEMSIVSEIETPKLESPTFYKISPISGARMMFVTKPDLLRSYYAAPAPHPKDLVKDAIKHFQATFQGRIEVISLAPASITLFGDFMEFHLGYIILMTLPLYVVTVGGRNDSVVFTIKTTLDKLKGQDILSYPVPCVRVLETDTRLWANHALGLVNDFKHAVTGFDAIVHSSVPPDFGMHSCAAMHSSIYAFLEKLTGETPGDKLERIDRCHRSELDVNPHALELIENCSSIKYFPVFVSKEGHLTALDCKKSEISNYFFDDPTYVFLYGGCKKNTTTVTLETLEERLKLCKDAIDILERKSLLNLDLKHLRCLKKRGASEEMIKRTRYVITEHQRTLDALKAVQAEDYERVGMLMTHSHASLRDDYEISSPEIEELYRLAMRVDGVLGAKLAGKGLRATILILVKLSDAENCIRYVRKNYTDKTDKPVFYIVKPAGSVYTMDPKVDLPYII